MVTVPSGPATCTGPLNVPVGVWISNVTRSPGPAPLSARFAVPPGATVAGFTTSSTGISGGIVSVCPTVSWSGL